MRAVTRASVACRQQSIVLAVVFLLLLQIVNAVDSNPCQHAGQDFVCDPGNCPDNCNSDMFFCKNTTRGPYYLECDHTDVFKGNIGRDLGVFAVLFVFLAMASAAGIGGGGVIIPMLLVITEIPPFYSVPLSVTGILGSAIVSFVVQIRKKHPSPEVSHRSLIDFQMALVLMPMALAGTAVGVLMNSVSPPWLIVSLIFITLGYTAHKTFQKAVDLFKKERSAKLSSYASFSASNAHEILGEGDDEPNDVELEDVQDLSDEERRIRAGKRAKLAHIINVEKRVPWRQGLISFFLLVTLVFLNLAKGGRTKSVMGIQCGSSYFFGIVAFTFLLYSACAIIGVMHANRRYTEKVDVGYRFVPGDIHYTPKTLRMIPLFATLAGLMSGFLGIGGGMIIGPLLLHFGVHPMVGMATTSFITLFTSSSSVAQYLVLGRIRVGYGIAIFILSGLSSFVGQNLLFAFIKKTGRNSVIAFIMGIIISVAAILLCVTGAIDIVKDYKNGESFGFHSLCKH